MAERDATPVKVTLDRSRLYRVNDADTEAVTVGPGEVEVPTWAAQAWGLVPSSTMGTTYQTTAATQGATAQPTQETSNQVRDSGESETSTRRASREK